LSTNCGSALRSPKWQRLLAPISEERRRPEAELWAAFEAERPRLLGVLLDAVVGGLKRPPDTRLPKLPRMADFALWATVCETALWPAGMFWTVYGGNRDETVEGVIDADRQGSSRRVEEEGRKIRPSRGRRGRERQASPPW
jgi:hypothetical protein